MVQTGRNLKYRLRFEYLKALIEIEFETYQLVVFTLAQYPSQPKPYPPGGATELSWHLNLL
jgi:hypothetical protein